MNLEALPWSRIHDVLLEVGSARTRSDFAHRVFDGVQRLIPYDVAAGFFDTATAEFLAGKGLSDSTNRMYNGYFRRKVPWMNPLGLARVWLTWRVDWREYGDSEYVVDFARPNGLRFGMGDPRDTMYLGLHRSKWVSQFSDRERDILSVIHLHLINMYRLYDHLAKAQSRIRPSPQEISERFPRLSRRESEVFALLVDGLTAPEIGMSLFISERTVESHLQSIYAKLDVHARRQAIDKVIPQPSSGKRNTA
ncbi:MAG TPA: helix-turn-helix transcriptional regulator [Spirochaetia bacterium]|nr:helix-turn-helix transcriptional regulator [Spirochaetia bacterium]